MKNARSIWAFVALLVVVSTTLRADGETVDRNPAAPDGFSWMQYKDVNLNVLVPHAWRVTRTDGKDAINFNIMQDATSRTGVVIRIINNVTDKQRHVSLQLGQTVDAVFSAARYGEQWKEGCDTVVEEWRRESPSHLVCGSDIIRTTDGVAVRIRTAAIANKKTDSMYIWLCTGGPDAWDRVWTTCSQIVNSIHIEDQVWP